MYRNKARKTYNDDEAETVWSSVSANNAALNLKKAPKYIRRILLERSAHGLNPEYALAFIQAYTAFFMGNLPIIFEDIDMKQFGVCVCFVCTNFDTTIQI